ncbi:hypothetical protein GGQ68_003610 [Sagittula marina]|uniref:Uncharacterized protein n=2 Tax=Sagittula marina TaxID=943940 RepID=A0A7W6DR55_9RHOB|nr:hypothetical protein [Sagittula marina]
MMLCMVMEALSGPDLGKSGFQSGAKIFFDDGNPDLCAFDHFEVEFAKAETIGPLIVQKDDDIFTRDPGWSEGHRGKIAAALSFTSRFDAVCLRPQAPHGGQLPRSRRRPRLAGNDAHVSRIEQGDRPGERHLSHNTSKDSHAAWDVGLFWGSSPM